MNAPDHRLRIVAWETTRRCPLHCAHCRGSARDQKFAGELTTAEGLRLLDGIAAWAKPLLILTGGEPMTRPDIYDLAQHATGRGMRVVMAPCGSLITPDTAQRMKAAGVQAVSISLDAADAAAHDAFRGTPGAFAAALKGIACIREADISFQINTTVTTSNVSHLPQMLELAARLGAATLDLFFFVPTGRGAALRDLALSPQQYEATLRWVAETARTAPIRLKTTCAPQIARLLRSAPAPPAPAGVRTPPARGAAEGCLAGRGFVFISHRGVVQPCGFLDVACGDLRAAEFDLRRIYETAPVFQQLRDTGSYRGACGACAFVSTCGGCRARAFAHSGDYLDQEPSCLYHDRT